MRGPERADKARAGSPVDYYCCLLMVEYGGGPGSLGRTEYGVNSETVEVPGRQEPSIDKQRLK